MSHFTTVRVRHRGCGGLLWWKTYPRGLVGDDGYSEVPGKMLLVCEECGKVDMEPEAREPSRAPYAGTDGAALCLVDAREVDDAAVE